jgi:HEAT repeat protein
MRFYCPHCWRDFDQDVRRCPHCGLDINEFWDSKDYVEKLILALQHPEKETPIRAAWLLGQIKDPRALQPLMDLAQSTEDVYLARAAVHALGEIGTPACFKVLARLRNHPAKLVRDAVRQILARQTAAKGRKPDKEASP